MQESTAQKLRAVAPQILSGQVTDSTPFCPEVVKRAIAILAILQDGEWHTAKAIGQELGVGEKYVGDILRISQDDWGLASMPRRGWMLVKSDSVIVV